MNLVEPLSIAGVSSAAQQFLVHANRASRRVEVERFVRAVYAYHYDAAIRDWMPTLVSLDAGGTLLAAAGYRAATAPLFLERYLGHPVESAIEHAVGRRIDRAEIVEVGHFASRQSGSGRRLMVHLGRHLMARGHTWVVTTATRELRLIFERLKIRTVELARADPAALGDAAVEWGSYYEHVPFVLAGEIRSNLTRFAPAS